jgi:hypothetical protein
MPPPPLTSPLVLGLDAAFLTLDTDPVLVLDPMAAFLALDPLLDLDATFLTLNVTRCPPCSPSTRPLLFLGPFPFSVPSLSR